MAAAATRGRGASTAAARRAAGQKRGPREAGRVVGKGGRRAECLYCAAPFDAAASGRKSSFCGSWCRARACRPSRGGHSPGVPYARAGQRERDYRKRAKEQHDSPQCRYCGARLARGRVPASVAYCSEGCRRRVASERPRIPASAADYRDAGEAERRRRRAPPPKRPTTCRYCGRALPKGGPPMLRMCSDECRERTTAEQRRYPVRTHYNDAGKAEQRRRRAPPPPRICKRCGGRIPDESQRSSYCGDLCARRAVYEAYRRNPAALELNRARQRAYARKRYATPEGRAAYLAASKRLSKEDIVMQQI